MLETALPSFDDGEMGGLGGFLVTERRRVVAAGTRQGGRGLWRRGFGGVDGGAPGGGVLGRRSVEGESVEVGIAEVVLTAVDVGAAEGFGDDVDLGSGAVFCSLRLRGLALARL